MYFIKSNDSPIYYSLHAHVKCIILLHSDLDIFLDIFMTYTCISEKFSNRMKTTIKTEFTNSGNKLFC